MKTIIFKIILSLLGIASLTGCAISMGTTKKPVQIRSDGIVCVYMTSNGFRPYDNELFEVGVLEHCKWGNLASIDVWPIGGLGISVTGARVKLLPFEFGFGVLGYNPKPEHYWKEKTPKPESDESDSDAEQE